MQPQSMEPFYLQKEPYYQPIGQEVSLFKAAYGSKQIGRAHV